MSATKLPAELHASKTTHLPGQWPQFDENTRIAVDKLLRSGQVNAKNGAMNRLFEQRFSHFCQRQYAATVCNGTAALEVAFTSLGLGPNDEVIVPARGFVANASAVMRVGALPVFADVCLQRQSVTRQTVEAVMTKNTRAISVVHLGGVPADIEPVLELAAEHNVSVVEDISQAHGARIGGRAVGSFGDLSVASFCQDKILTTGGEGGMVLTDKADLIQSVRAQRDHGQSRQLAGEAGEFVYARDQLGSNYRLSEIQAVIGVEQLKQLDHWVEARRRNATILDGILGDLDDVSLPPTLPDVAPSFYRYYVTLGHRYGDQRAACRAIQKLNEAGVPADLGSCPELYQEPLFKRGGEPHERMSNARCLGERTFALPVHPGFSEINARVLGQKTREVLTKLCS